MKNNQELIEKAITSLSFGGGIGLSFEESNRFIDYMVDQSFLKNNVRIERMNSSVKKIDKIGLGERILRPGISAVDPGNTIGISTTQMELKTKEVIAIVEIGDDSIEDNIEGDALVDHIMQMVAKKAANELELAYMYGRQLNVGTPTHVEQLFDGWLTRAKDGGHIVKSTENFYDRHITQEKLSKAVKAMPQQYRVNRSSLRFFSSDDIAQDYSDTLSQRLTTGADIYVQGMSPVRYGNILMQSVALMKNDNPVVVIGGASTTTTTNASAGASTIVVASAADLSAGKSIVIGLGTAIQETATIISVSGSNVVLSSALSYTHGSGSTVKEASLDGSDILLTDANNLILGIQRNIKVETQRNARTRTTSFVLTLRVDTQVENLDACVVLQDLLVK